jgi:N-acetyl-beta-hexosaminidase
LSVICDSDLSAVLEILTPQFSAAAGIRLVSPETKKDFALNLVTDKAITHNEGYNLDITKKHITLRASSGAGIFYGMQSLLRLLAGAKRNENATFFMLPVVHKGRY